MDDDKVLQSREGLTIIVDDTHYADTREIRINGSYSKFVNCGSQYAIWYQFPRAIRYTLKDLDSGKIYMSIDNELSISHSGNDIYNAYAEKECGKIITEKFSILLSDVYFIRPAPGPLRNSEVSCTYCNDSSNTIKISNILIQLKSF